MIYGPIPIYCVDRLKERLAEQGSTCQVYSSEEAFAKYDSEMRNRPVRLYPSFQGAADLLYVDIALKDLLIVKQELQNMGIVLNESDFDPQLDSSDYMCPKCKTTFPQPGLCPKHQIPLVEYSQFVKSEAERGARMQRIAVRTLIGVGVAWAVWAYFH